VVEAFTEETARTRRIPGIAFRGDDAQRRPWVIDSGLDVWEIIQMLEDFGSLEALMADTQVLPAQIRLAMAYRDSYPDEIAEAIVDNKRPITDVAALFPFIALADADRASDPRRQPISQADRLSTPTSGPSGVEPGVRPRSWCARRCAGAGDGGREDRILVTRNSRDFAPWLREWSEAGRHHGGCILIWTLDHHEFGATITGITRLLLDRPYPEQWRDLAIAL
jgi:hypothetical protein